MKYIDHFYSFRTYSGSLEGPPVLSSMYKTIRAKAERLWGERAILLIEPPTKKIKGGFRDYEMLPEWCHMAWVTGPAIKEEFGADGSQLIVIWFSNESCFNNYEDVIAGVDWDKHAENFGW